MQAKKQRIIKDFFFLTEIPKQQIQPNLIKRIKKEGIGEVLENIHIPFDVYVSYQKYDYEGRLLLIVSHIKAKFPITKPTQSMPTGVFLAIKTMKLYQSAWINARSFDMHMTNNLPEVGCHFLLTIEEIKYKDVQNLEAKKKVVQRNKEQGRKLFKNKEYDEAMKRYRTIINISEGLDLKKFTKPELEELEKININGKRNFMKCFCKIKRHDKKIIQQANQYTEMFWKLEGETEQTLYFKGYTLMHSRVLTKALEIARKLFVLNQVQGQKLFDTVKQWKKAKMF